MSELVGSELVRFTVHENYGTRPEPQPVLPGTIDQFRRAWTHCFGAAGPRNEVPDKDSPSTITIGTTDRGRAENHDSRYEAYLSQLRDDFGWD